MSEVRWEIVIIGFVMNGLAVLATPKEWPELRRFAVATIVSVTFLLLVFIAEGVNAASS